MINKPLGVTLAVALAFHLPSAPRAAAQPASILPVINVDRDNVSINQSCLIRITAPFIADSDNNGVIHIDADNLNVHFVDDPAFRELCGAPKDTPFDQQTGIGISIINHSNVTLRNAHAHRFRVGIWAVNADNLTLELCDVSDGFAMRLRSSPSAEDGADWLWPHANDNNEWATNYGAGIYVENSKGLTIRNCFARRRQNGIVLDQVNDSKIYDNDCSFLSGWGLAMWRSSRNVITRNAFDFCVRGYSHKVYNRGQDSAGILMFEQNCDNLIAENSATHGGDCFFGFAGREALGEIPPRENMDNMTGAEKFEFLTHRRGNNRNLLINNDFSYAPAHGIEMTFSFDNQFIGNRLVGNAICGVWGGYSQDTLIAANTFQGNGEMAYGAERGGVNIEHGRGNRIEWNTFKDNKCGVYLWWDADEGLMSQPWAKANERGSSDNSMVHNTFDGDTVGVQLRESKDTIVVANKMTDVSTEIDADDKSNVMTDVMLPAVMFTPPPYEALGETRPVGARIHLRGRENIVMTEWGPWDHESPLLRRVNDSPGRRQHDYELIQAPGEITAVEAIIPSKQAMEHDGWGVEWGQLKNRSQEISISCPPAPGVYPYHFRFTAGDHTAEARGVIQNLEWSVRVFPWTVDPRTDLDGWHKQSQSDAALEAKTNALQFAFGMGGPSQQGLSPQITDRKMSPDHFGTIATTRVELPAGAWRITTNSDDGIRVTIDGKPVIDNWTWHGPTKDTDDFTLDAPKTIDILVEHFEIDGYAVLEVTFEPAPKP